MTREAEAALGADLSDIHENIEVQEVLDTAAEEDATATADPGAPEELSGP